MKHQHYIEEKVLQCMEEWKSSTTQSLREIMAKYFSKIFIEAQQKYMCEMAALKVESVFENAETLN
ncbi:MAG: hypothetical protein HY063_03805 [Bacteroidetes bacterium]|nr:hypothetical protein [Bacteroidota bacterium]